MKTIGILGGMCWESTIIYYQEINKIINKRFDNNTSAKCIIYSINFHDIESEIDKNNWDVACEILKKGIKCLEMSGVDFIIIASNTAHKLYNRLQETASVPIIHIADCLSKSINNTNKNKVLLLGTKITMEEGFIKNILTNNGIQVLIPNSEDRNTISNIINKIDVYNDNKELKNDLIRIINNYNQIEGIILGCTELGIVLKEKDIEMPIFDTAIIHATDAAFRAIN